MYLESPLKSPTTAIAALVSASVKLSPRSMGVFTAPTKRGICGGGGGGGVI